MNILERYGFTENEVRVYEGFLKYPLETGAELARKVNMDKSSVYRSIETLRSKGLLFASQGDKGVVYESVDPSTLRTLHRSKEIEIAAEKTMLETYLDDLITRSKPNRSTYMTVEKGIKALQHRMTESLSCKEKLIRERFRFHPFFDDKSHVDFVIDYANKRVDSEIMIYELDSDIPELHETFKGYLSEKKNHYKEIRLMPRELIDNNSLRIWDDTVNILSFDENNEFILITIKDHFVAELMKNMYDFIWNRSERPERSEGF